VSRHGVSNEYNREGDVREVPVRPKLRSAIAGVSLVLFGANTFPEASLAGPSAGVSKDNSDKETVRIGRQFRVAQLLYKISDAVSSYVEAREGAGRNSDEVRSARKSLDSAVEKLVAEVKKLSEGEKKELVEEFAKLQRSTGEKLDMIVKRSGELQQTLRHSTPRGLKELSAELLDLRRSLRECEETLAVSKRVLEAVKP
jgi:hypothetical protein